MRTTIDIEDDILSAARAISRREKKSLGQVISRLARRGLTGAAPAAPAANTESFLGFRPLPPKQGVVITDELVQRLREDEGV